MLINSRANAVMPLGNVEDGWQKIKNDYWLFFAMTLVELLITLAVSFAINSLVGFIAGLAAGGLKAAEQTSNAGVITQLILQFLSIFASLILLTLAGMFNCGIFTALSRKADGDVPTFSNLFDGFNFFQPCLIVAVVLTLINFLLGVIVLGLNFVVGVPIITPETLVKNGKLELDLIFPSYRIFCCCRLNYSNF